MWCNRGVHGELQFCSEVASALGQGGHCCLGLAIPAEGDDITSLLSCVGLGGDQSQGIGGLKLSLCQG